MIAFRLCNGLGAFPTGLSGPAMMDAVILLSVRRIFPFCTALAGRRLEPYDARCCVSTVVLRVPLLLSPPSCAANCVAGEPNALALGDGDATAHAERGEEGERVCQGAKGAKGAKNNEEGREKGAKRRA